VHRGRAAKEKKAESKVLIKEALRTTPKTFKMNKDATPRKSGERMLRKKSRKETLNELSQEKARVNSSLKPSRNAFW